MEIVFLLGESWLLTRGMALDMFQFMLNELVVEFLTKNPLPGEKLLTEGYIMPIVLKYVETPRRGISTVMVQR